jgi:hypothetical protein
MIKHSGKSVKPVSNSESLVRPLCHQDNQTKTPRFTEEFLNFLKSYSWCTIADVKITLPDDPESDIEAICKLLDSDVG